MLERVFGELDRDVQYELTDDAKELLHVVWDAQVLAFANSGNFRARVQDTGLVDQARYWRGLGRNRSGRPSTVLERPGAQQARSTRHGIEEA
ncbi:hypothetical protein SARC_09750 [Sphaeroforma arctica JP610]|uniref:Uncharacterized protein n=1 Tax=Sphaeroforma arctica JP610 TaxID=667725 RepID=A0A0L0FLZ8_9EUKA|nr:hypothetical protein SARC_09750 [Sphaeroforma arctica JP610]KNC77802.1 hypothetical protein SARC_09750 [Sphaeroforma arctica JP610]|eukprot:XP_014151704.1 hypothetical protein SARC_09750 [Sphaeroforma arctica JP610]